MSRLSDYDIFITKFQPIENQFVKETILFETYGEEWNFIKKQDIHKIWTLLDCNGKLIISPGCHWVNRMNYFITKNSWKENQRDYIY